ncbi:TetR/AcrR family transcriptional regulator [Actinosynnema sp.]|uniref:TetR/AcrR family transcriptional regulator n=1 Tax=Actinosynnema sp. TaxID=1872144 RepID=UPI003F84C3A5
MPGSQTTGARGALLAAAARVFSDKGFFGTRITDITAAAGVSAGSFYTYFESKEEILGAVMDEFRAGEPESVTAAPASSAGDAEQWLRAALTAAVATFVENARMWRAVQQAALGTEQIRARVRDQQDEVVAAVAAGIAPLVDGGLAGPRTPAEFVARALVAMTDESLFQWYLLHDQPLPQDQAVDRLLWGWQRLLRLQPAAGGASRG